MSPRTPNYAYMPRPSFRTHLTPRYCPHLPHQSSRDRKMWFSGTKQNSRTHCAAKFLLRDSWMRIEAIRMHRKRVREGGDGGAGDGELHQREKLRRWNEPLLSSTYLCTKFINYVKPLTQIYYLNQHLPRNQEITLLQTILPASNCHQPQRQPPNLAHLPTQT